MNNSKPEDNKTNTSPETCLQFLNTLEGKSLLQKSIKAIQLVLDNTIQEQLGGSVKERPKVVCHVEKEASKLTISYVWEADIVSKSHGDG